MASTLDSAVRYVRAPNTVGLLAAILLAMAAGYVTQAQFGSFDASFLVIIALGVSAPNTLDTYDLLPETAAGAVLAVVVAALAHWVVFLALFVALLGVTSELIAAMTAFAGTALAGTLVGRSVGGAEPSFGE